MITNPLKKYRLMKQVNWQKLHRDLVEAETERDAYRELYEKALQEPQALRAKIEELQADQRRLITLCDQLRQELKALKKPIKITKNYEPR